MTIAKLYLEDIVTAMVTYSDTSKMLMLSLVNAGNVVAACSSGLKSSELKSSGRHLSGSARLSSISVATCLLSAWLRIYR